HRAAGRAVPLRRALDRHRHLRVVRLPVRDGVDPSSGRDRRGAAAERPSQWGAGALAGGRGGRVIPTHWFLILSAILFSIGVCGVLTRKNGITIFMSIELMVNAVNLTFLAYARQFHQLHGMIFVFFVMAIAAAEAAVGLAIFISLYHHRQTIDVDDAN